MAVKRKAHTMVLRRWISWLMVKASRDTTSGQFIAEMDGLRFIAIFSVIFFHLEWLITSKTGRSAEFDLLAVFLSHGSIGVQLFFVISGFVIALPFAKGHFGDGSPPQLQRYFLRRLTRLEPPYFINLLVRYAFLLLITGATTGELLPHLFASIGYLHNVIYGEMSTINCVAWSLEVELQFYVLAPFITKIFQMRSKSLRRTLFVALIAFFSAMSFAIRGYPRFELSIFAAAQYFLTGFLLVDVYLADWAQKPEKSIQWDVVSVLAWSAICALPYQGRSGELFLVIPVFFAYVSAFKGSLSNRFFCQPIVYVIGGMCYTIYLYHFSLISAFVRLLTGVAFLNHIPLWIEIMAVALVAVPIIVLCCTFLFIFIEKPCMRKDWHLRLLDRFRSALGANA